MKIYSALLLALLLTAISCEKEEPPIVNEEEVITTLIYTLTPENGGNNVIFSFTDLDGDGGDAPVIVEQTLQANTVYNGTLELLNEQESPAESITEEIEEEDDEHQFFFDITVSGTSVAYDDADGDGNPVGLSTKLSTGEAGTGTMTITLRHEPMKDASGVSDGNISNAGGETDIEVEFNVTIQ